METSLRNAARERLEKGEIALGVGIRQARTVDIASIMKAAAVAVLIYRALMFLITRLDAYPRSTLVSIAGKTGTAQVVAMKGGYVKTEQLAYLNRDHAWFVSYAPVENPQIAVVVLIKHGGHGASAAAPLAKKVIEKYMELQNQPADQRQVRLEGERRAD